MNNKKVISLVLFILGFLFLCVGWFSISNENNNNNNNVSNKYDENYGVDNDIKEESIDFNYVYELTNSLYGGEGKKIEIVEQDSLYIIRVKNVNTGQVLNEFSMDKKTGVISDSLQIISSQSKG